MKTNNNKNKQEYFSRISKNGCSFIVKIDKETYEKMFYNTFEESIIPIETIANSGTKIRYLIPRNNIMFVYKVDTY